MKSLNKIILVLIAFSFISFAETKVDTVSSTEEVKETKQVSDQKTQKSLSKKTIISKEYPTNWSKIKDLFM
jgi:hypothetical protein